MRIAFFGTPMWAVPTLERLIDSRHDVVCVVTQPDKSGGRGRKPIEPPVKNVAIKHDLRLLQPEKARSQELCDSLSDLSPDLVVLIAYGKILPSRILDIPRLGCLNIHLSLLPKYRGAAPVQHAIINGETATGVTVMEMDEGCDTGGVVASREVDILEDDDAVSLGNMLSVVGADLLMSCLDEIEEKQRIEATPQDDSQATMAPKLTKEDGIIDWTLPTHRILLRIRGLKPWPISFTFHEKSRLKILDAEDFFVFKQFTDSIDSNEKRPPGTVCFTLKHKGPVVRTGDGYLVITRGQPENKREMSGEDLVNGKFIEENDLFTSAP